MQIDGSFHGLLAESHELANDWCSQPNNTRCSRADSCLAQVELLHMMNTIAYAFFDALHVEVADSCKADVIVPLQPSCFILLLWSRGSLLLCGLNSHENGVRQGRHRVGECKDLDGCRGNIRLLRFGLCPHAELLENECEGRSTCYEAIQRNLQRAKVLENRPLQLVLRFGNNAGREATQIFHAN